jgi:hypothetical protein
MEYFRKIDKSDGPVRIFIGGVHGKEGLTTIELIKEINNDDVVNGKLLLFNCPYSKYISTLDPRYYKTEMGKAIIDIIKTHKPGIYVELHCYKPESYHKLINLNRKDEAGVPPLIELENGVLISSVSPYLRTELFKRNDVCITLEMPCNPSQEAKKVYFEIMKEIAGSDNRMEFEKKLQVKYPVQVERARKYAAEFFGEYPAF